MANKSPPYPYQECNTMETKDLDFCLDKDCDYLVSTDGHQVMYCSLGIWKQEEKFHLGPSNEDIWEMLVPEDVKMHFIRGIPHTRKEWAREIYDVIWMIENSSIEWDERSIKILDDAYDYCDYYGLSEKRDQIKKLRIEFFVADKKLDLHIISMDRIRGFFHDEWWNPTDDQSPEYDITKRYGGD